MKYLKNIKMENNIQAFTPFKSESELPIIYKHLARRQLLNNIQTGQAFILPFHSLPPQKEEKSN